MNIASNTALFSLLGTTYGGNGTTTFALPNLQGSTILHASNAYPLGAKGGSSTKQLTVANLPAHTHVVTPGIKANTAAGTTNTPVGAYPASTGKADPEYNAAANTALAADSVTQATVSTEGGSQPLGNMQPYLAVNFIIALYGVFPPRS
jgi:microcystin-dependent protein